MMGKTHCGHKQFVSHNLKEVKSSYQVQNLLREDEKGMKEEESKENYINRIWFNKAQYI